MSKTQEIEAILSPLSSTELVEFNKVAEAMIAERTNSDVIGFVYTQLREKFFVRFPSKADLLQPWTSLKPAKQKEFKKFWCQALKGFESRGFESNSNLNEFVIHIIASSHLLKYLNFQSIIEQLEAIDLLYEYNFPGWIGTSAEILLQEQLS